MIDWHCYQLLPLKHPLSSKKTKPKQTKKTPQRLPKRSQFKKLLKNYFSLFLVITTRFCKASFSHFKKQKITNTTQLLYILVGWRVGSSTVICLSEPYTASSIKVLV